MSQTQPRRFSRFWANRKSRFGVHFVPHLGLQPVFRNNSKKHFMKISEVFLWYISHLVIFSQSVRRISIGFQKRIEARLWASRILIVRWEYRIFSRIWWIEFFEHFITISQITLWSWNILKAFQERLNRQRISHRTRL